MRDRPTPITDAAAFSAHQATRFHYGEDPLVDASVARRLETDRAALIEALDGLVKANEDWNAAVAQFVATPPTWSDVYLDASRDALAAARANFPES